MFMFIRKIFHKISMVSTVAFALAIGAISMVPAQTQAAVNLGLTPSHVCSLWININGALVAIAGIVGKKQGWTKDLEAMTVVPVTGRKPSDVLEQARQFRGKLNKLRQQSQLPATAEYGTGDGVITPSVVFLNSGHILDATAQWLIKNTGREMIISEFYTRHDITGKKPSDAYALIVLANRRIDSILSHVN